MTSLRIVERRNEERVPSHVQLLVWGVDTRGERFVQHARAQDISLGGALLSGLESDVRSGDVVGILYDGKKARFRVIWVRYADATTKLQAAVQRLPGDLCPWEGLLQEAASASQGPG